MLKNYNLAFSTPRTDQIIPINGMLKNELVDTGWYGIDQIIPINGMLKNPH